MTDTWTRHFGLFGCRIEDVLERKNSSFIVLLINAFVRSSLSLLYRDENTHTHRERRVVRVRSSDDDDDTHFDTT